MPKPEFEFFDVATVDWTPVDDRVPGLRERILARDDQTGVATRILKFEPGTDTRAMGVQPHPFWEEVYILEGSLHDLTLGQTFPKGYYACRPPGMRHGPWIAPEGCVTFEVRYYAGAPHSASAGSGGQRGAVADAGASAAPGSRAASFDSKEFRRACGQFATGVAIVTTRAADGTPVGVTANSFTSVSLDPPLVLVCLDKRLGSYRAFRESDRYAVHVLSEHQATLSTRFATRGLDKFAGLDCRTGSGGVPILPGYLALFECVVEHVYDGGDHTIFVGRVQRLEAGDTERPPLAFFRGKYVRVHDEAVATVPPAAAEIWSLGWA